MDEQTRRILKGRLRRVIQEWLDSDQAHEGVVFPWVGNKVADHMATAALTVLQGMADSQEYLRREGMLEDGLERSDGGYDYDIDVG